MVGLTTALWVGVLLVGVWVAHWGADKLAHPLAKLRRQWALAGAGGGALVGLAVAMPEVALTTSSALQGASSIGLGIMVGGNVLSLPLLTSIAYLASRAVDPDDRPDGDGAAVRQADGGAATDADDGSGGGPASETGSGLFGHPGGSTPRHLLAVDPAIEGVVVLPYVVVVAMVALLTLPAPLRGLQPVDGVVMVGAYAVYLAQALLRSRTGDGEAVDWSARELALSAAGLVAIVAAAYAIVRSTEQLATAVGVSRLFAGLFITAPLGLAPEAFGTWSVVRSGQVTAGAVDVFTDATVTMTLAFLPLTLVGLAIEQFRLYWVSLAFALALPVVYAGLFSWRSSGPGLERWQVLVFDALYLVYVAVVAGWVLPA